MVAVAEMAEEISPAKPMLRSEARMIHLLEQDPRQKWNMVIRVAAATREAVVASGTVAIVMRPVAVVVIETRATLVTQEDLRLDSAVVLRYPLLRREEPSSCCPITSSSTRRPSITLSTSTMQSLMPFTPEMKSSRHSEALQNS
jgi:hypothetical protein